MADPMALESMLAELSAEGFQLHVWPPRDDGRVQANLAGKDGQSWTCDTDTPLAAIRTVCERKLGLHLGPHEQFDEPPVADDLMEMIG